MIVHGAYITDSTQSPLCKHLDTDLDTLVNPLYLFLQDFYGGISCPMYSLLSRMHLFYGYNPAPNLCVEILDDEEKEIGYELEHLFNEDYTMLLHLIKEELSRGTD